MVLTTLYERYFVLLVIFYFLTFHPSWILIAPTINTLHSCSSCCRWALQSPLWQQLTRSLPEPQHPKDLLGLAIRARLCHHATRAAGEETTPAPSCQVRPKHWCLTGAFPAPAYTQHSASTATLHSTGNTVTLKNTQTKQTKRSYR